MKTVTERRIEYTHTGLSANTIARWKKEAQAPNHANEIL